MLFLQEVNPSAWNVGICPLEVNLPVDCSNNHDNWYVTNQEVLVCLEIGRYPVLGTAVLAKNVAKTGAEPFDRHFEHIVPQLEWSVSKK